MIPFVKMQGIGNDFVMVDAIKNTIADSELADLAKKVNDRKFGIGGDGLILIHKGKSAPFEMRMFNPDGSESEMCGNGIRCFAKLLQDLGYVAEPSVDVETGAGTLHLELESNGMVRVNMGKARLTRGEIGMVGDPAETFQDQPLEASTKGLRGTAVSMGNPHLVIFVEDVAEIPLKPLGSELESYSLFPRRTNVHFIEMLDRNTLLQRTWERGAGATLACGTGACASAVAAFLTGRAERKTEVQLPGGSLFIEFAEDNTVYMTGPAQTVFEGTWNH